MKSNKGIKEDIFSIISEITGHPMENLDKDMFLESDLGFDSIKMINLMNSLMNLVSQDKIEIFTERYPVGVLMTLDTIGDIIDIFEEWEKSQSDEVFKEDNLKILNAQYPFLASYFAVGTITICSGVKLSGELNLELLKKSYLELIDRNVTLKAYFEAKDEATAFKEYTQLLKNPKESELEINLYDFEAYEDLHKEDKKQELITNTINEKFSIFKWPLHKLIVVKENSLEYEILFANSHLISDGLGNQSIIRELLNIYSSKLNNLPAKASSKLEFKAYNSLVENINSYKDERAEREFSKYLKEQGREKYFFNPENKDKKVLEKYAKVKNIKTWLEKDTLNSLKESAKKLKISLYTLIVSAYIKTLLKKGEEDIVLNLPTSGKNYRELEIPEVVGCFAQNLAIKFSNINKDDSIEVIAKKVNNEIMTVLTGGFDIKQVNEAAKELKEKNLLTNGKMTELTASFIRSSLKSNLYLSFIGNTRIQANYSNLTVVDYEAYTSTNAGAIDNVIEIFQDRLFISSNYDSLLFEASFIKDLMDSFVIELKEINGSEFEEETVDEVNSYNAEVVKQIQKIINDACGTNITEEDFKEDIETKFGIDSLEKIRIVARISKAFKNVNRDALFECRTIIEFAKILSNEQSKDEEDISIPFVKIMQQVIKTPEAAAINFMGKEMSYEKLDTKSNRLANYLREQGISRGSMVGIMTLPGPLMLIGMLGILKAGGAYVPIDPNYPVERVKYILSNSNIKLLLSEQELKKNILCILEENKVVDGLIFLDEGDAIAAEVNFVQIQKHIWEAASLVRPQLITKPEDLMLVIYTSGSTGNPKGVMLTHEGYMNRLVWHQKMFKLQPKERVAQRTSCCFDISIWELFWPLMYGGTVCPVRKDIIKNPWKLAQWIIDLKINVMHFVPSLFGEFINSIEDENYKFKDLRALAYSGEALPMSFIQKWIDKYGMKTNLVNLYGPTEASIDVTYHVIEERPENSIPIGKPIDNVYILNLDEDMREVKEGEIGELWIGGMQLAKGYLNNKEKTEAAFKPNPFKHIPGEYLYRTGDLTRKNPDGSFEYHGRIDNQIKIRGFRVELGEIEAILDASSKVKEAAVIAVDYKEDKKKIIAFVVSEGLQEGDIKELVAEKAPEYMIPHVVEFVKQLPKTPNGKTDRKALIQSYNGEAVLETNKKEEVILPLAPAQKWLMSYFEYPYEWAGFTRFKYKEKLDFEGFNKALLILTRKHEILRCILHKSNNKWAQKILDENETLPKADYYDASFMEEEAKEKEIQRLIVDEIKKLKVNSWPLWKAIVVKTKDMEYDISVIGHHLIADIITNKILFEDIWKIYSKVLLEEEYELKNTRSYSEFINEMQAQKEKNLEAFTSYWKEKFYSEDTSFNIETDFNKGLNTENTSNIKSFKLNKDLTRILLGHAKKHFAANVYSMLLAALYKTMAEYSKKSNVVISHRVHGRELGQKVYFDVAGDFAVNFPMAIEIESTDKYVDIVEKIKKEFEELPLKGVSYDLVSERLPFYMYPDSKLTSIRANYLGNRELKNYNSFEFSKENTDRRFAMPEQKRTAGLEFFFYILNGEFILDLEYSNNYFKAGTIENLGNRYMLELKNLICEVPRLNRESKVSKENKENKVVLVTGANRGIGREIALYMAEKYKVIAIMGRDYEKLLAVKKEIQGVGSLAYIIQSDIKNLNTVKSGISELIDKFGQIDILVNNAGITKMAPLVNIEPEDWINIINTNLIGTYNLCFAVTPYMLEKGAGKIINIGSDSSFIGYPLMTAYAASKHGVLGLTKALSEELKLKNIQVNAVCPALVATDMAPKALKNSALEPKKVAKVVAFLASKESDCITGEAIQVNGTQDMHWFGSKQVSMLSKFI